MREQRHIMRLYSHTYAKPSCVDSAYYAAAPPPPPQSAANPCAKTDFARVKTKRRDVCCK